MLEVKMSSRLTGTINISLCVSVHVEGHAGLPVSIMFWNNRCHFLLQVCLCPSAKCKLYSYTEKATAVWPWISSRWTKHTRTILPSSWGIRQRGVSLTHTPGRRYKRHTGMKYTVASVISVMIRNTIYSGGNIFASGLSEQKVWR